MTAELENLRIDADQKATTSVPKRRIWIWVIVFIGIAVVGYFYWRGTNKPIVVQTVRAQLSRGDSESIVLNATGYVVAAHKIELAPKVSGRAEWVGVDMGDRVHQGDVLVRLENEEFRAQVRQQQGQLDQAKAKLTELQNGSRPEEILQAKGALQQAQAELDNAKSNFDRLANLMKKQAISQHDLDDAQSVYLSAQGKLLGAQAAYDLAIKGPRQEDIDAQKATVEQAQGMVDLMNVNLANTIIRAPVDGTILDRNVEVGEYVTTGFVGDNGAKGYVVSMADLNDLKVDLDISQNDFNKVSQHQRCDVTTDAYPDRHYEGDVDQVSPQANRQKATVLVKVKILHPDGLLRPDMNASVSFFDSNPTMQPAQSVIVVPASAVKDGAVWVAANGIAAKKTVTTAGTNIDGVRVIAGLSEGDNIILNPPANLSAGAAVTTDSDTK